MGADVVAVSVCPDAGFDGYFGGGEEALLYFGVGGEFGVGYLGGGRDGGAGF